MDRTNLPTISATGSTQNGSKRRLVEHAGPGIENLHRIGAGLDLPDQIGRRMVGQHLQQLRQSLPDAR